MDYCQQTTMLNYATGCQLPATQSSMQSNQFAPHKHTLTAIKTYTTHTQWGTGVCYRDWSVFMLTRIPRRKCGTETEQEDSNEGVDEQLHRQQATCYMATCYMPHTHTHTYTHCMHACGKYLCDVCTRNWRVLHGRQKLLPHVSAAVAAAATYVDTSLQVCLAIVLTVTRSLLVSLTPYNKFELS